MTYEDLIKEFGNQASAAKALNFSAQRVSKWKTKGIGRIPLDAQRLIEYKTGGKLKADKE